MDRDEVMAMTDEELRIKAAELMGWTDIGRMEIPVFNDVKIDMELTGWAPGTSPGRNQMPLGVPDYPNDIAAAWELLWKILAADGVIEAGIEYIRNEEETRDMTYFSIRFAGEARQRWPMLTIAAVPKAITRAFILAMQSI